MWIFSGSTLVTTANWVSLGFGQNNTFEHILLDFGKRWSAFFFSPILIFYNLVIRSRSSDSSGPSLCWKPFLPSAHPAQWPPEHPGNYERPSGCTGISRWVGRLLVLIQNFVSQPHHYIRLTGLLSCSVVNLASVCTPEMMAPILTNAEVQQRLLPFLPSGESLLQSADEIQNTLNSPQFQQVGGTALNMHTHKREKNFWVNRFIKLMCTVTNTGARYKLYFYYPHAFTALEWHCTLFY